MASQIRWIWLLYFLLLYITQIASKELRVVCYYTNWSVYRPGTAKFSPQNINPYLCTHLVYAFGGFTKENTLKPFDKYQDIEKGGYAKFTGLKTYNKNLKTMLAIGGWNEGSSRFSPMVASPERRKELVKNVVKFLRQNHFDGLDLDWEYPSFRDGGKPRDRDNYAQLVQELREEFERETEKTGRPRLLLTMAVPAGIEYINKGYDVPKLMKYLDWMNILSYDYHSAFEPSVNHHAPLFPLEEENEYNYDTDLNIDHTIQHYLKAGAIPDKLVLGIPTYGRSYTLFNADAYELGAPADGPGEMGDATRENGYLAYYEICESVKNDEWTVVQPNENAMGPYAYKEDQWVGYDDEAIARKKAQYVAEKDLGGIMFWAIDNDDFRGTCHNKPYPIIEAAKEALIEALGVTEENAISKSSKPIKSRGRQRAKANKATEVKEKAQNSGGRQSDQSSSSRRRLVNRVHTTEKPEATKSTRRRRPTTRRTATTEESYRKESGSSLVVSTPSWKTPEPPTTPDPGGDFKCEDEGFFPHPRDCKKYFWCLSGPSELGIVAHQFTCPAGLYFNKAAASCDYTQNVLCNKNKKTATTTTTTSKPNTTEAAPVTKKTESLFNFSTRRPPPKITAATSKTTLQFTTSTTPYYDDEYEFEDDSEDDGNDSEAEDPKVIKELLELIKKAGGIEELEKQLNIKGESTSSDTTSGTTPSSSISKKIFERVLAKAKFGDGSPKQNKYTTFTRNSRGPQNEGLRPEDSDSNKSKNSRPKYSTISRQRSSKLEKDNKEDDVDDDEEDEEEEEETSQDKGKQYITLRRNRPLTPSSVDNEEDTVTSKKAGRSTTTRSPYVTLKRSRPTTEAAREEEDTVQSLNRKVLGENDNDETNSETSPSSPKYVGIQRSRPTTEATSTSSRYKELRRGTPSSPIEDAEGSTTEDDASNAATRDSLNKVSDNTNPSTNDETTPGGSLPLTPPTKLDIPQLLEPRPFSINSNVRSTRPTTTTEKQTAPPPTKRSRRPISRFRPESRRGSTRSPSTTTVRPAVLSTSSPVAHRTRTTRRRFLTPSTPATPTESRVTPTRTSRGPNRFRVVTRKHYLSTTRATTSAFDQSIESSNQESHEQTRKEPTESSHFTELALALQNLQQAPVRSTLSPIVTTIRDTQEVTPTPSEFETTIRSFERSSKSYISSSRGYGFNELDVVTKVPIILRPKTTTSIPKLTTARTIFRRPKPAEAFEKIPPITSYTYKPISEYDYYDDGVSKLVGSIPEHSKVLIHSTGVIQCLDQGNFPHPVSCKKFISCAKMETGAVLGWEYTCPKNLSFDPVGGMCNWSAGLGCNE